MSVGCNAAELQLVQTDEEEDEEEEEEEDGESRCFNVWY